jgi:putative FmdB family regulatory protein
MPFYEYRCESCGDFELLRPMADRDKPAVCPGCGHEVSERKLTTFAAVVAGSPGASCPQKDSCPSSGFG